MSRRWSLRERALALSARFGASLFFRAVEVDGADRFPAEGPVVIVANHANGVVDPLLIMGFLPAPARPLVAASLRRNPLLRVLLALAGAIPVRRRVEEDGTAGHEEAFGQCHARLLRGGCIMMFPEGASHDEPRVLSLKTGAARIVLESGRAPSSAAVRIVPVGLVFDAKHRFRSRALIVVGEALDPAPELEFHSRDPREAARRLTARIEAALARVAPNYGSWEEERLLRRAASIYARPQADVPAEVLMAERVRMTRAFLLGYRRLKERQPELLVDVEERVRGYDELLRLAGVRDGQVASSSPWLLVGAHVLRALQLAFIMLPSAVAGTVLNWLPYRAAGWIAAAWSPAGTASWKLYASFGVFPFWWTLLAAAAWWTRGGVVAAIVAVAAPYSAWQAMLFHEARWALWEQARGFLRLRASEGFGVELRERRRELVDRIGELVAADRATIG